MGRPSKYTPDTTKRILDAIRLGATLRLACQYAGVDTDSVGNWRKAHPEFAAALNEAEGAGAVAWLAKIEQAASSGDWRAAAWKLACRFPQEYGKTVQEVQGKDGGAIELKAVASLSDEELDERISTALQTGKDRAAFPARGTQAS